MTDDINSYNGTLFSYYLKKKNEGALYELIWEDSQNLSLMVKKKEKKKQVSTLCNILCNKGENGGKKYHLYLLGYATKKQRVCKKSSRVQKAWGVRKTVLCSFREFLYLLVVWTTSLYFKNSVKMQTLQIYDQGLALLQDQD